jgi:hypothetical protein
VSAKVTAVSAFLTAEKTTLTATSAKVTAFSAFTTAERATLVAVKTTFGVAKASFTADCAFYCFTKISALKRVACFGNPFFDMRFSYFPFTTLTNLIPLTCLYSGLSAPNFPFMYAFTPRTKVKSPFGSSYNDLLRTIRAFVTLV